MNNDDALPQVRGGMSEQDAAALGREDADERAGSTDEAMVSVDDAETYLAPIDPPVIPGGPDGIMVAQGFASSSDGEIDRMGEPGDEEITRRVVHLLRTDAATTALHVHVRTVDGIVHLSGKVVGSEDADLAEEVAGRVHGVVEVIDAMTVEE